MRDAEEWDQWPVDDSWLHEYIEPSDALCRALRIRHPVQRLTALCALAEELSLDVNGSTSLDTWDMLSMLCRQLSDALSDGHRVLEDRSRAMADAAVSDLSLDQARRVMKDFGWVDSYIPKDVSWRNAPSAAQHHLANRLTTPLQRAMLRWSHKGTAAVRRVQAG